MTIYKRCDCEVETVDQLMQMIQFHVLIVHSIQFLRTFKNQYYGSERSRLRSM